MTQKFRAQINQFSKALKRLEEVLKKRKTVIIRDSAIKRFEFSFDLAWKLIKTYLAELEGITCLSPRDCIRQAYKIGLISYRQFWLKMIELRNLTSHTYKEKLAARVYSQLPKALLFFQELLETVKGKVQT